MLYMLELFMYKPVYRVFKEICEVSKVNLKLLKVSEQYRQVLTHSQLLELSMEAFVKS